MYNALSFYAAATQTFPKLGSIKYFLSSSYLKIRGYLLISSPLFSSSLSFWAMASWATAIISLRLSASFRLFSSICFPKSRTKRYKNCFIPAAIDESNAYVPSGRKLQPCPLLGENNAVIWMAINTHWRYCQSEQKCLKTVDFLIFKEPEDDGQSGKHYITSFKSTIGLDIWLH